LADCARQGPFAVLFVLCVPLWHILELITSAYTAERVTGNSLVTAFFFSLSKLVLLMILIPISHGAFGIFLSWMLGTAASITVGFILIRRIGKGYFLVFKDIFRQLRHMSPLLVGHHLINISGSAPVYFLPFLVTSMLSAADNAYFYTTWVIGTQFSEISVAVAVALFAEGSHSPDQLMKQMKKCFWILTALFTPIMVIYIIGGRFILSIFGPSYSDHGWILLMFLTAAAVSDATTSVYISMLRVQKRLRSAGYLNSGMALITLGLSWLFLPVFGIAGAGLAWLISQSIGVIGAIFDLQANGFNRFGHAIREPSLDTPVVDTESA